MSPRCSFRKTIVRSVLTLTRIPANCPFTSQHSDPDTAQTVGAPPTAGLGIPNGGLQVVNPSQGTYDKISAQLNSATTSSYDFADQSLLGDVFHGRWVAIPYIYNALKTLRWKGVHDAIWRDEDVKNVHYILSPKPWDEWAAKREGREWPKESEDPSHAWWISLNEERLKAEEGKGLKDGF